MLRSTAFASFTVLVTLAAVPATLRAQAPADGRGYPQPLAANVVGGGGATISGGGDDMVITYDVGGAGGGSIWTQVPRLARAVNTTTGKIVVEYLEPERAPAGPEAWLVGGGDGAEVVYANPVTGRQR